MDRYSSLLQHDIFGTMQRSLTMAASQSFIRRAVLDDNLVPMSTHQCRGPFILQKFNHSGIIDILTKGVEFRRTFQWFVVRSHRYTSMIEGTNRQFKLMKCQSCNATPFYKTHNIIGTQSNKVQKLSDIAINTAKNDDAKEGSREGIQSTFTFGSGTPNYQNGKHNYRLSPGAGPYSAKIHISEAHQLIAGRQHYRKLRDFRSADYIRKKLERSGIFLDDGNKRWRGDGIKFSLYYPISHGSGSITYVAPNQDFHQHGLSTVDSAEKQRENSDAKPKKKMQQRKTFGTTRVSHGYTPLPDTGPKAATISDFEIQRLLTKHWYFKSTNDISSMDKITNILLNAGVFVDEELLTWRSDGVKHHYKLSADASQHVSELPESKIHTLLEMRMRCKWKMDYKGADQIRQELKLNNVFIDDKAKEWRADGLQYYQYNHSYKFPPDAIHFTSTLTKAYIHKLISDRWQCKLDKEFDKADKILDELYDAGVYINDATKSWRADGKCCNYCISPNAGPIKSTLSEMEIHKLLETHFMCKLRRDFVKAALILEQLRRANVFLDENENQWRGDGVMHNYGLSRFAGPNKSTLSEEAINDLLGQRWQCKISHDFDNADRIYFDLYKHGIFVDDDTKEWRADGIYHLYKMSSDAGNVTTSLTEGEIHRLIGHRLWHRRLKDFVNADKIYEHLKEKGIYIDDTIKEWRADGIKYPFMLHKYRLSPKAGEFNAKISITDTHKLLSERWRAKLSRDFDKADTILEQLNEAGVHVNDDTFEWRADNVKFKRGRP